MSRNKDVIIGIDVGGTFTRIGLVDNTDTIVHGDKVKTLHIARTFNTFVLEYLKQHQKDYNIRAISIGFPGIVSATDNEVISLPNLHILEGHKYLNTLKTKANIPVFIEKDTNNLFITDLEEYNLYNVKNILGFYLGTGFGNAIRINGSLLRGDTNAAAEIGHIPIPKQTMVCGCGNMGCLETIVSGKELERIHRTHFPDEPITTIFEKNPKHHALNEFVENLARAVTMQITMLDTTTIILGGGVIAMVGFPKSLLVKFITENVRSDYVREKLTIYYSKTSDLSGIKGAAINARHRLEEMK